MLAARNRLTTAAEFTAVTRRGDRRRSGGVVVYLLAGESTAGTDAVIGSGSPRFGLIVGKSVGGSVVRHAVSRKLRHQLRSRIATVPAGSRVVVRALPEAAGEDSARLGADLDRAFERLGRGGQRNRPMS